MFDKNTAKRFFSKVQVIGHEQCWPFHGKRDRFGYGLFKVKLRDRWTKIPAHRFAMMLHSGRLLESNEICCHQCDNPSCCNPRHIIISNTARNIQDRVARGRSATGERNGQARLTDKQAECIRLSKKSNAELALEYGVHNATISRVRRGLQHTPKEPPHAG